MTVSTVVAIAVLAGGAGPSPQVPLAAAMVLGGKLVLVDIHNQSTRPYELPGLTPLDADLSPDRKLLAFSARDGKDGRARIFLMEPGAGKPARIETNLSGEHRFPRFSDGGATVLFSAAKEPKQGGPENPMQVFRLSVKDKSLKRVPTEPGRCEFAPVGLQGGLVAHVSTHCFMGFDLLLTDRAGKQTQVAGVSGPDAELAVSADGKKLLYTTRLPEGVGLFLKTATASPKLLATVAKTPGRLQPSFVCPRDVLLAHGDKLLGLNTDTGVVTEVDIAASGAQSPTK